MSPNDIEILIHCHTSPIRHPRHNAPAVIQALDDFVEMGVISPAQNSGTYAVLCNTPCPQTAYVDQAGQVIVFD